jgi:nucleoside-diphosphate-sugar epimerase
MNSLIIGSSSQLSYYFPIDYDRISSRDINYSEIFEKKYDSIYILFAEQRTFLNESEKFFTDVNVSYTLKVVNKIKDYCNNVVIFSTSELWNNYDGEVLVNYDFNYNYTPYIKSKEILSNHINEYKSEYNNVHIIYPFNFNSPYRKEGFLFSKIFDSIINKNKNTVGSLNFYRDLIHPSIIVKECINTYEDKLIGCGTLINIGQFVIDLFNLSNLEYNDYIIYDENNNLTNIRKNYYSGIKYSNYNDLLKLTHNDIRKNIFSKRHH